LSSDHSPIILTLSSTILRKQAAPKLTNKFTNWDLFRKEVSDNINLQIRLKTPYELEEAVDSFTNLLTQAAKTATPVSTHSRHEFDSYPKEIVDLIKERRKARHRWQQSRDPRHKTVFNNLCKMVKKRIYEHNNDSFNHFVASLGATKDTDYKLWKVARKTRKPPNHTPPLRRPNNTWARSDEERAETYAEHLEMVFQPNDLVTDVVPDIQPAQGKEVRIFSPTEIRNTIKVKLDPKKAPGHDQITAQILQELPHKALVLLTYLFNAVLRLQYVPRQWKLARIIMLPKPGKPPEVPSSYRPISLLPVLSKLFEKLYIVRLQEIIKGGNLIPDHQFEFQTSHSTVGQVRRIGATICQALEEKKFFPAVFLDVGQRFPN